MTQPPYPQRRPSAPPPYGSAPAPYGSAPPYGSQPPRPTPPQPSHETRRDVEAALAAQQELGPDYADQIAAGLADRVEQLAAYRTAELRQQDRAERDFNSLERNAQKQRFVTAIVSLGAGIPITGIAAVQGGLAETAVCWAGIVGVNMAQALSARRRRN